MAPLTLACTPSTRATLKRWQVTRKVEIERELSGLRCQRSALAAEVARLEAQRQAEEAALLALTARRGRCEWCRVPRTVTVGVDGRWRCARCRCAVARA